MKSGIAIFACLICFLVAFAACQNKAELDITTAESTTRATATTENKPISLEATSLDTNISQRESDTIITTKPMTTTKAATTKEAVTTKPQDGQRTTRPFPESVTPEIKKNKETLMDHVDDLIESCAEYTAKELYAVGINEISGVKVEKVDPPNVPDYARPYVQYYMVRFVDEQNQVYHMAMDLYGSVSLIFEGEPEINNLIFYRE